jgi:outer membrane protein assembly factor BamB
MCVFAVLALAGCDWAEIGFDAASTSNNAFEPAITATSVGHLAVAWSQPCACGTARILVAGGVVYDVEATTIATAIRAFDAQQGTPKWSKVVTTDPSRTFTQLTAAANGLIYVIVGALVVALDAGTGAVRWTMQPPAPGTGTMTVTSLLVDGTEAFVSATASISNANPVSEVSALDPAGHIIWSNTPGGEVGGFAAVRTANAPPDSTARTLDVVSTIRNSQPSPVVLISQYDEQSGGVHQVVLKTGATAVATMADVSASGGLVYFHEPPDLGTSSALFAVDPVSGAVAWSGFGNEPYAVGGGVVASTGENRLTFALEGLDAATGRALWGPVPGVSRPAIANGIVFITDGAVLNARDLANGSLVGTFSAMSDNLSSPVTPADGRIYVGSSQRLYALAPTSS